MALSQLDLAVRKVAQDEDTPHRMVVIQLEATPFSSF